MPPVPGDPISRLDELLDATVVGSYTRLGYRLRSRRWKPLDTSLTGKTVVITGATSGLGRAAAAGLAELGARVVLVGRDPHKAAAAADRITAGTGGAEVGVYLADLSSMTDVRRLAGELLAAEAHIDMLVNNAGVLFPERRLSEEGIELTLATNLLSHFLLTSLLLPRLRASAPARIINVSSGGMYTQRIDVDDLQSENGYRGSVAYARTKRGQVILTEMWAEAEAESGVVVHAMHPGWADTPGVATSLPRFRRLAGPLLRTPEEGADTIVWLAAADEPGGTTGLFWLDRRPRPTYRLPGTRETPADRVRLWDELSRLSGWSG